MGHFNSKHIIIIQSASKVVGIRKDPTGLWPVRQPWGRFRFFREV